jgi:hypothetical protein
MLLTAAGTWWIPARPVFRFLAAKPRSTPARRTAPAERNANRLDAHEQQPPKLVLGRRQRRRQWPLSNMARLSPAGRHEGPRGMRRAGAPRLAGGATEHGLPSGAAAIL